MIRIDKWLWYARLCKTRSLAGRLCVGQAVQINGRVVVKPAQPVHIGDQVTLCHGGWRRSLTIQALGARRGPASEAAALYTENAPPLRLNAADPGWVALLAEDETESDED